MITFGSVQVAPVRNNHGGKAAHIMLSSWVTCHPTFLDPNLTRRMRCSAMEFLSMLHDDRSYVAFARALRPLKAALAAEGLSIQLVRMDRDLANLLAHVMVLNGFDR